MIPTFLIQDYWRTSETSESIYHYISSVAGEKSNWFTMPVLSLSISHTFYETIGSVSTLSVLYQTVDSLKPPTNKIIWDRFEQLFGIWENRTDLDEDWLDQLRDDWDNRLTNIYDSTG